MISLQKVSKVYTQNKKKIKAVDSLSFQVQKNEVFGFLGPNGAGKTTTLKLIIGLLKADSGDISINGLSPESIEMKKSIGFLPENPYFYQYLTGEEFLRFCGNLFSIDSETLEKRIKILLSLVSLKDKKDTHIRNYSKGMLQRIGIAQSLINNPEIIFWDEPMSGLDPIGRKEVKEIIHGLKNEGKTVFFCTHILEDVETLCDKIAIIHNGKLLCSGLLSQLIKKESLESFFMKQIKKST